MIKNLLKKLIALIIPKHIIYCKDCIYRNTDDCAMYYECDCGVQYSWETDGDFCSWAKNNLESCNIKMNIVKE